ncbi:MAG TPA: ABC transporter permease [Candidatus Kapabacteria bacterium]|nr:ABC transporter permease [Candidatus Kapabacteria bacterium]
MNWRRMLEIARWEYLQKVRAKSFVLGLLLTPMIIGFGTVVPGMLAEEEPEQTVMIGLIDTSGALYGPLRAHLDESARLSSGQPAYVLANYAGAGTPREAAIRRADSAMLAGTLEGAVVVDDSAGAVLASYRSLNPGNPRIVGRLERAIETITRARRLAEAGIDTAQYARLAPDVELTTLKIDESGVEGSSGFKEMFFTSFILSMLLMILVLTTGGTLVRSLIEEKSNRIMEILASSATPQELLWGKLIGLSGLGITQLAAWLLLGAIGVTYLASGGVVAHLGQLIGILPLLTAYLMLGYMFYAAVFIGLGSLVTTEQEAQVMTSYLVMLLMTPTIIAIGVISNPDATWLRVLSYIPTFTPSLMMLRIVTKMPPTSEIVGTLALMVVSTVVLTWACSRIFRTAILMYGKRPTVREVLRWLGEA